VEGAKIGKPEPIFPRLDKAVTLAKLDELAEADRNHDKPEEKSKPVESENAKSTEPIRSTGFPPVNEDTAKMAVPRTPSPGPLAPTPAPATDSPKISIEDFAKVEMRTGEIKAAERVPGATKLLKLQVDIGSEIRQVVAGIAEYYEPEKLIGMKVVIVANLQPRKLRGVESNGMIVAASPGDQGRPVLVTFNEDVPNGARLR
jgi:methionyl-tRNA synthetase